MLPEKWRTVDGPVEEDVVVPFPKKIDARSMTDYFMEKAFKLTFKSDKKHVDNQRNFQSRLQPWQWKWIDQVIYKEKRFSNPSELIRFLVCLGVVVFENAGFDLGEIQSQLDMEKWMSHNRGMRDFIEDIKRELIDDTTKEEALNRLSDHLLKMDSSDPFYTKLKNIYLTFRS